MGEAFISRRGAGGEVKLTFDLATFGNTTPFKLASNLRLSASRRRITGGQNKRYAIFAGGGVSSSTYTNVVDAHNSQTSVHGATSAATANTIIMRDSAGRAKVAAPSASDDIARKDTVDNHAGVTSAISTLGHVYEAEFTATITAASWSGTTPPYSNAVTVSGITSSHNPIIDVIMSGTYSTDQQRCEQWGNIYRAVTSSNTITFYAHEKPTIDFPIRVKVVM